MKTAKTILGVLVLVLMLTTVSCKDAKKEDPTTKTEQSEKKAALKKMRACSVYATAYNVSRLTASKFADIINRYHKHTRITIDFIVEDIRINSI